MSSPPAPEAKAPAINITAPTPVSSPPAEEADLKEVAPPLPEKEVAPPLPEKEVALANASQDDDDGASVNQYSDEKIFYEPSQQPAKDGEGSQKLDRNGTVSTTSTKVASPVDVKGSPSPPYAPIDENSFPEPIKDRDTLPEVIKDRETLPEVTHNGAAPSPITPDTAFGYSPNQDMSTKAARETLNTVTPLHLLQDQPDIVDCPFCRRQALTEIKKAPSPYTHAWGGFCFFIGIFVGTVVPYVLKWNYDTDHYCTNCKRKVATRRSVKHDTLVHGTPEHLREVSRFPAA